MRKEGGAMKRLLLLGVGSALMFTIGGVGPAQADNGPHVSTAVGAGLTATMGQAGGGRCASCHRAHTAKAEMLLKEAQPALCFSCHANGVGASTDVVNGVGPLGKGLRGGGFTYALINGAGASKTMGTVPGAHGLPIASEIVPVLAAGGPLVPGTAVTSKHQIDGTTAGTMWGNGAISATIVNAGKAGVKLECASCHDPHGNGNYRILKPIPNDAGTLTQTVISPATTSSTGVVTPAELSAPATGVNIPDAAGKVYTTSDYWSVRDLNVPLQAVGDTSTPPKLTDGYIANVAQWCSTCHTRYLAGSGSYKINSGDAVFTYRHRSNRNNSAGVSRPNCIQCHVSHGSNVAMSGESALVGLPGQPTRTDPASPSPDSRLLRVNNRGTCVMCHNV